jgi:lipooligosaccharide transport system permease protein
MTGVPVADTHTTATGRTVLPALRVAERGVRFFLLTWKGVVFSLFGVPILYLVALGYGLGGLVAAAGEADLAGLAYLTFIAPGVAVGAAAQTAAGSSLWPIMAGHRWVGFFRSMVATPLGPDALVNGYLGWLTLQAAVQAGVILVAAQALGGIGSGWAVLAVPVAAATSAAAAAPLMAVAARADSDQPFDPLIRLVIVPLHLFSGAFFPTSSLPSALEWVLRAAPLWHGVTLARAATTGGAVPAWLAGSPALSAGASLVVIGGWLVVGWVLARRAFVARLTP